MSGHNANSYDEDPYMQYIACNTQNSNCSSQEQINQAVYERNHKDIIPPQNLVKIKQPIHFAEKRPGENDNCAANNTHQATLSVCNRPQLKLRKK